MSGFLPSRGDIWLVDLGPTPGHEQAGRRPALVVSTDAFNQGPAGLVVVLPITTTERGIPLHVPVNPPEGGVRGHPSYRHRKASRTLGHRHPAHPIPRRRPSTHPLGSLRHR
ncbi:MAG: type II toxin-antitoxin system PemK/MazF family toxin [Anaerolineae bacterium]